MVCLLGGWLFRKCWPIRIEQSKPTDGTCSLSWPGGVLSGEDGR